MNDVQTNIPGHDGRTAADVRASLSRSMDDLKRALGKLERVARSEFAIGNYVAEHAVAVLLVGLVGGAVLGALTVPNRYVVVAKPGSRFRSISNSRKIISRSRRFPWK